MAKCPNCGTEVKKPRKKWKMAGRPDRKGKRTQLEIGLFDCPKCKKAFRAVLSKKKI
ncbi:chorismate-binding protein [Candidatus Bathyarchaeota archaeon]|nr:MAG: chorismate-binding protein [Candidatus Bathyarchaeota archaeon]HDI12177.1 chorismate-binding protein [Candidatus Bathyarchaeota archaeon]